MVATARTVSLTEHQQKFLDAQVQAGRHGSTSEVVREALRRYEDDVLREQAHLAYLRRLGDEGEAAFERSEYTSVKPADLRSFLSSLGRDGEDA
jgi:antitoxin ParD1/3/4